MIEDKVLESNVTVLRTPLVDIEIVDEDGNKISFDIVESGNNYHMVDTNYKERIEKEVTDFDEKRIRLRTASLEIGKLYYVKSSVPIEFRSSDERLFTYGITDKTQTFAITFSDPHDDYKAFPEFYEDGYKMKWYDFNREDLLGTKAVSFNLIDRELEFIYIATAWIWNIQDNMDNYESAVDIFTWIVI